MDLPDPRLLISVETATAASRRKRLELRAHVAAIAEAEEQLAEAAAAWEVFKRASRLETLFLQASENHGEDETNSNRLMWIEYELSLIHYIQLVGKLLELYATLQFRTDVCSDLGEMIQNTLGVAARPEGVPTKQEQGTGAVDMLGAVAVFNEKLRSVAQAFHSFYGLIQDVKDVKSLLRDGATIQDAAATVCGAVNDLCGALDGLIAALKCAKVGRLVSKNLAKVSENLAEVIDRGGNYANALKAALDAAKAAKNAYVAATEGLARRGDAYRSRILADRAACGSGSPEDNAASSFDVLLAAAKRGKLKKTGLKSASAKEAHALADESLKAYQDVVGKAGVWERAQATFMQRVRAQASALAADVRDLRACDQKLEAYGRELSRLPPSNGRDAHLTAVKTERGEIANDTKLAQSVSDKMKSCTR